jgi:hypothetical protein
LKNYLSHACKNITQREETREEFEPLRKREAEENKGGYAMKGGEIP